MHVDWSEAFEYEKFRVLHVNQTIWEGTQIVLSTSKCRGVGQQEKYLEAMCIAAIPNAALF